MNCPQKLPWAALYPSLFSRCFEPYELRDPEMLLNQGVRQEHVKTLTQILLQVTRLMRRLNAARRLQSTHASPARGERQKESPAKEEEQPVLNETFPDFTDFTYFEDIDFQ